MCTNIFQDFTLLNDPILTKTFFSILLQALFYNLYAYKFFKIVINVTKRRLTKYNAWGNSSSQRIDSTLSRPFSLNMKRLNPVWNNDLRAPSTHLSSTKVVMWTKVIMYQLSCLCTITIFSKSLIYVNSRVVPLIPRLCFRHFKATIFAADASTN